MLAHRRLNILLSLLLAVAALSLLLLSIASAAGIAAQEAVLNPAGALYEMNQDHRGDLWISDSFANEIWQVNPPTGVYTVYQGMSNATDARMDAAGAVWWTDAGLENTLGRIDLGAGTVATTVTTWTVTGAGQIWGLGFDESDANGLLWVTDVVKNQVYSFASGTEKLCTYLMPDDGASDYVVVHGTDVWLGDNWNARIVKLNTAANEFTSWQLSDFAWPEGLALAENGDLWWADLSRAELGRLQPGANRVTTYTLPAGTSPTMIALDGGQVWYTENMSATVGILNPAVATGTSSVIDGITTPVTPSCRNLSAKPPAVVITGTGTLEWSPNTYERVVSSGGLTVYQLPDGAYPWGVATSDGQLWVADGGRQRLLRLPLASYVYLPLVQKP